MRKLKYITAEIKPQGIKMEAHGYDGCGCTEATAALEAEMGEVRERKLKPSFYRRAIAAAKRGIGIGGGR